MFPSPSSSEEQTAEVYSEVSDSNVYSDSNSTSGLVDSTMLDDPMYNQLTYNMNMVNSDPLCESTFIPETFVPLSMNDDNYVPYGQGDFDISYGSSLLPILNAYNDTINESMQDTSIDETSSELYSIMPTPPLNEEQQIVDNVKNQNSKSIVSDVPMSSFVSTPKRKSKHEWTTEENLLLKDLVQKYGGKRKCWPVIAQYMNTKLTAKQCREHYKRIIQGNNKSTWSYEEDEVLTQYLDNTITYEELTARVNRTKKQIGERIAIRCKTCGAWSSDEMDVALNLYHLYNNNWTKIVQEMQSRGYTRTYQQVKGKVTALLKKTY